MCFRSEYIMKFMNISGLFRLDGHNMKIYLEIATNAFNFIFDVVLIDEFIQWRQYKKLESN